MIRPKDVKEATELFESLFAALLTAAYIGVTSPNHVPTEAQLNLIRVRLDIFLPNNKYKQIILKQAEETIAELIQAAAAPLAAPEQPQESA